MPSLAFLQFVNANGKLVGISASDVLKVEPSSIGALVTLRDGEQIVSRSKVAAILRAIAKLSLGSVSTTVATPK